MLHRKIQLESRINTWMLGLAAAFLVIFIVLFPKGAFDASLQGLTIWWKIVFPALLPFLVVSEILIAYGVVHQFGVLLEPLMRLLFRVPGIGGWAVAVGFTAGYPAGAEITSQLRTQKRVSRCEGERLLALSHMSSLTFIVIVIAVGFYEQVELGMMIASIHFISAFLVGLLMRFHQEKAYEAEPFYASGKAAKEIKQEGLIRRSFSAMHEAHLRDGRTLGKLLGDAVTSSIQTLMIIGGYMMMFSVILKVITLSHLASLLQEIIIITLVPLGFIADLAPYILNGLFEVNLGTYSISQASASPLVWQAALIGVILGWSGISMHAQVKSLISATDLRYTPFLISRILHACIAFFITFWLWSPLNRLFNQVKPSFLWLEESMSAPLPLSGRIWISLIMQMTSYMVILVSSMICISGIIYFIGKLRKYY